MDWNSQFRAGKQLGQVTVEPFIVIDGREVELGVLLERQIVSAFALSENPFVARNASLGGSHVY